MCEDKEYTCSQCGCELNIGNIDPELIDVNDLLCEDCKFEYEKETPKNDRQHWQNINGLLVHLTRSDPLVLTMTVVICS
ncbi:MAG: hypothetical protein PF638_16410 [Candidatus Delongbacteria bacterium]|jgi:DNA-directed RNA polymerase subunit RPC12/RpoP|nr:hypothetical protein [Candidatus Delongbacteria bacterium]